MATRTQAQKPEAPLCKRQVRVALASRGWVQSDLAKAIKRSITSVNLAINHGTFPNVVTEIRKKLGL